MIYFIRDGISGHVKIGVSADPWLRLGKMQSDCPGVLTLLGYCDGGTSEEAELHQRFAAQRVRGEWFRFEGPVAAEAERLTAAVRANRGRVVSPLGVMIQRLSDATGAPGNTVRFWIRRNRIPGWHWMKIVRAEIFTLDELCEHVDGRVPPESQRRLFASLESEAA